MNTAPVILQSKGKFCRAARHIDTVSERATATKGETYLANVLLCGREAGQRGGVGVAELAVNTRPLARIERYSKRRRTRREPVGDRVGPPAIELAASFPPRPERPKRSRLSNGNAALVTNMPSPI
jgi:hypothetical protein